MKSNNPLFTQLQQCLDILFVHDSPWYTRMLGLAVFPILGC